jgi:hypothetical protein
MFVDIFFDKRFLYVVLPAGLYKAPHDSGVCFVENSQ